MYPTPLNDLIELFEHLPEQERRENLIVMSDAAKRHEPKEAETFELEDVRKDEECTDAVGVFLRTEQGDKAHFAITLGPKVQTLTKAMTSILCRRLNGLHCAMCSMCPRTSCHGSSAQSWCVCAARRCITC